MRIRIKKKNIYKKVIKFQQKTINKKIIKKIRIIFKLNSNYKKNKIQTLNYQIKIKKRKAIKKNQMEDIIVADILKKLILIFVQMIINIFYILRTILVFFK